jgi:flagellar basal-body rod protein FlgB
MSNSGWVGTSLLTRLERFLDVSVARQGLVLSNLANIDTPGYRTRDVNFEMEMRGVQGGLEEASFAAAARPVRGLIARPDGNNVSLERETLSLARTQLGFSTAIQLMRAEFKKLSIAINEGSRS